MTRMMKSLMIPVVVKDTLHSMRLKVCLVVLPTGEVKKDV